MPNYTLTHGRQGGVGGSTGGVTLPPGPPGYQSPLGPLQSMFVQLARSGNYGNGGGGSARRTGGGGNVTTVDPFLPLTPLQALFQQLARSNNR